LSNQVLQVLLLSDLFQNAVISKQLELESCGWSHFLSILQEIPFCMNFLKIDSQGASSTQYTAVGFFTVTHSSLYLPWHGFIEADVVGSYIFQGCGHLQHIYLCKYYVFFTIPLTM
jgi:hypothetical protein